LQAARAGDRGRGGPDEAVGYRRVGVIARFEEDSGALFALRNQGEGYFLIGFDDKTHLPTKAPWQDIHIKFHQDMIQALVSKYASQPFETSVLFVEREAQAHPVIRVDAGVRCPVACKADLKSTEKPDRTLLRESDIFVRTLLSNGTVSSARTSLRDLEDLMQRCFESREEDYALFLARSFAV
jgi:hypothetical protein